MNVQAENTPHILYSCLLRLDNILNGSYGKNNLKEMHDKYSSSYSLATKSNYTQMNLNIRCA